MVLLATERVPLGHGRQFVAALKGLNVFSEHRVQLVVVLPPNVPGGQARHAVAVAALGR